MGSLRESVHVRSCCDRFLLTSKIVGYLSAKFSAEGGIAIEMRRLRQLGLRRCHFVVGELVGGGRIKDGGVLDTGGDNRMNKPRSILGEGN